MASEKQDLPSTSSDTPPFTKDVGTDEKKLNATFSQLDEAHYNHIVGRLGKNTGTQDRTMVADDVSYVLEQIGKLSLDDSLKILADVLQEHSNDLNFPTSSRDLILKLLDGPEDFDGEDYEFEVKAEAAVNYYFSPYAEIRAVTDPNDDDDVACETLRSYFLGLVWAVIGQFINSFFNSRYPAISITSSVCQTLLYPSGKLCEWILPDWGFTFRGTRYSLNPGPWTYKEQMFSTIMFDVSLVSVYVFWNIQTEQVYYNDTWLTSGYCILLILSTQCMGLGFAGILRRFVVFPIEAIWPSLLPTLALNRALLVPEKKEKVHGWTISRYSFFFIVFGAMFVYYWLPGYLFTALSYFSWMTWIKPSNFNLAMVTGSQTGLSFNPISSFDWNLIGYNYPLNLPFFSYFQQYIGTFISGLIILIVYYTNNKWSGYLPINSSALFNNQGGRYNVSMVMTNGRLDEAKYQAYSPPFYSAGNLIVYGAFFLMYPLLFCYVILDQWKIIARAYGDIWSLTKNSLSRSKTHLKQSFTNLSHGNIKGFVSEFFKMFADGGSIYDGFDDPFTRAIKKYPEVPNWWFYIIVIVAFIFAIIILEVYPLGTPVWTIFFVIGINLAFLVPMNLMSAITGSTVGLNVLVELIIGYALPGNPEALMFVKAYGYNIDGQASNYTSDQKMAHYAHIPPRAVFRGQVLSSVVSCFIAYAVVNFVDSHIDGICTPEQTEHFTCSSGSRVYFSASVVWGLIGPKRVFSQQYPVLKWMFLLGFLLALAWWSVRNFGPKVREFVKDKAPSAVYTVLNWTIFKPLSCLHGVQPALIGIGFLEWAPLNLSFYTGGMYVSFIFMYYLRRYKTAWWEKYNFVLSAGLSAGLAFSAIIVFFAVQYHEKDVVWWGNSVLAEGVDGGSDPRGALLMDLPEKGYFGPDTWS